MKQPSACIDTPRATEQVRVSHSAGPVTFHTRHAVLASAVIVALSAGAQVYAQSAAVSAAQAEAYASESESESVVFDEHIEVQDGLAILEGDMILGSEEELSASKNKVNFRGFGHTRTLDRWPNGIVPYGFDDDITSEQRTSILQAIAHYHDKTRISFEQASADDGHDVRLMFRPNNGCASYVGRTDSPSGEQDLFVQNCTTGSIIHELAHAIGMYHEHTRRDRDNFITVKWDEIIAGKERNFEILTDNSQHYGDYDYGSIMHYGESFFSRSGAATIEVPDGINIGQRERLSPLDIATLDVMYATDLDLAVGSIESTLQDNEGSEFAGYTVDVTVTNIGGLGAHQLTFEAELADDTEWLTISQNSGWSCGISAAKLTCEAATLEAGSTRSFALTVNAGSGSIDDLAASLSSRTLDTDASNNTHNGGVDASAGSGQVVAEQPQAGETEEREESTVVATTDDETPVANASNPSLGAAEGTESGGGAAGPLLLTLAALHALRRRKLRIHTI